ncbi:hypothetical protein ZIOFF_055414 [Zingiber officinale]|uniref:SMC hinge domain-containing protein n=1 Tax=Zingiber officinale TaxID=94328 RepID=A0A8J5FF12_ZINOF|nr:hypothetical protein ZIOFF_055414 [Zingiber officinale]
MHIKQVIIEGFKSYKEEVSTEPFSPRVNCVGARSGEEFHMQNLINWHRGWIHKMLFEASQMCPKTEIFSLFCGFSVGANGSGKTNFFHVCYSLCLLLLAFISLNWGHLAIRFVLSDLFQNLRSDDRHALLHEGAGHQVVSAFVEIVFDNSDNRIPVSLLLIIHMNMRLSIASLTLMKDSERLDLLKEIGGTRVYEERRRESLKIMQETGNKRKQIDQVVQYLEERLRELDEEKEELKKYQQLDKQRRSLEYTIYDKELSGVRQKLGEVHSWIEESRNKVSEKSSNMHNRVLEAHENLKLLEKQSKILTKELQSLNKEKEEIEKKRTEALKMHTQIELDLRDVEERLASDIRSKEEAARQLESLRKEIQESRDELNTIRPLHQSKVAEEEEITKGYVVVKKYLLFSIMEREKQLSILYQKQGRATQFANKAARDKWLQREIDDLDRVLSSNVSQEKTLQDEIEQLKEEERKLETYIRKRKVESEKQELLITNLQDDSDHLCKQRDELQDLRKSLWSEEANLSAEIDKLKSELIKAQKSLDHATPGDIRRGLNSVNRIIKDHNIKGVFGPILELVECDSKFFTAVEVTAGNSLFHVVVETDDISTRIIRYLTSEKGGRITFIPLNRVKVPHITYPQSSDVVPLLKKLKFRSDCASAVEQSMVTEVA